MDKRRILAFLPLVLLLPLVVMFWRSFELGPREVLPSALIDQTFPEFSLPSMFSGETLTQKAFVGTPVLVNFWGSWCVSCLDEHPLLMSLSEEGVVIVGVNYKDDPQLGMEWLQTHGNPYSNVVVDRDGSLGIDLGVYGAPSTFVVDADGVIRAKNVGVLRPTSWESFRAAFFSP